MSNLIAIFFVLQIWCQCTCMCFIASPDTTSKAAIADTECGKVEGIFVSNDDAFVFRGMPYAQPPVGNLRWTPPIPVSPKMANCWNGTYIAKTFGNACYQRMLSNASRFIGDEDCLYINVWTPTLNTSARLPVMFWIHGGYLIELDGNQQGIGYAPTTKLAQETGIVYVSINYRLNAFGFMALEWLKERSQYNTSGNYGFMDMIAGLQWVQANIQNFGGDPNQVTIFGQSSGGTSAFALLSSPLSKGLFHRAWLISASPVLNKTATDAFKDNEIFVRNTNCTNVDCLYNLSAHDVIASIPWDVYPYWSMTDLTALPIKGRFDGALAVVDGHVLPEAPFDAWVHGNGIDVPVLVGTTAQEIDMLPIPDSVANWTWSSGQYEKYVRHSLGSFSDVIAETALKLYPIGTETPEYQFTSMASDARMTCGNDYLSLIAATSFTSPVYRYVAKYSPSQAVYPFGFDFPSKYSFHGIDIFGFFGTMGTLITVPSSADLAWETNVRKEILSFVKNGKPASEDWKPYPSSTALLSLSTNITDTYHASECEFWLNNGFFSYCWIN